MYQKTVQKGPIMWHGFWMTIELFPDSILGQFAKFEGISRSRHKKNLARPWRIQHRFYTLNAFFGFKLEFG